MNNANNNLKTKESCFENSSELFSKAKEFIKTKNYADATLLLDEVLEITPDFYPALYEKSMIAYNLGELDSAEKSWNESFEKEWLK